MPYTFNGTAKTITIQGSGAVEFTANDLYSRWVDWVQSGVGAGFDEVVRAIGGEDIGNGLTSGVYVFLGLGWSLVVPSAINTLTVAGNVTRDPDDGSGAPLYINQGSALIIREVSAVALGYSTSGGGGGEADWTTTERSQIRHRLGIDGATNTPTATPNLATTAQLETARDAILTQGNSAWVTATGFSTLTSGDITAALTTYTVPTLAQVEAAGFTTTRHNALLAAESAARAVADGRHKIDYAASTATQYNADGSERTVFDLLEADGSPATSGQNAVERVPQ